MSDRKVVDLDSCFAAFDELWAPRTVATMNDYDVRVVKVQGEFVWHHHEDTDELFLVTEGRLTIDLEQGDAVELGPGEIFVVPAGEAHRPRADELTKALLLEPSNVVNTGSAQGSSLTAERLILDEGA
ncbi:MAG: cupin domain-containing protein [Acidimicrobiia bacterium]